MQPDVQAPSATRRGLLLIVCSALLWGTVGVATQGVYKLAETNALSIGFYRLAFAVPVMLLFGWRMLGASLFRVARRDLPLMVVIGVAMAGYQVCLFSAIPLVGVSIAVLVTLCTAPVIVALGSALLFGERLTARVGMALVCALGGTLLLAAPDMRASGGPAPLGLLYALGSAGGYALLTLCSRKLAGRYHPLQPLVIGFSAGALVLLPFALLAGLTLRFPLAGWALLLHLGVMPTALAYALFLAGMRHISATSASIITLLEPLTAAALAWLLFGERLGPVALLGAVLLIGAIALLALRPSDLWNRRSAEVRNHGSAEV